MKHIFAILCLAVCAPSFAGELTSYNAVQNALLTGEHVRIVADYSKCTYQVDCPICGSVNIKSISIIEPMAANIGENRVIEIQHQDSNMPEFKFDKVNYTYEFSPDDTVKAYVRDIDNKYSYSYEYNCKIGQGIRLFK